MEDLQLPGDGRIYYMEGVCALGIAREVIAVVNRRRYVPLDLAKGQIERFLATVQKLEQEESIDATSRSQLQRFVMQLARQGGAV
jgi:hypothetical protein